MPTLINILLYLSQLCLLLAMLCCLWRLLWGPAAQDRVLALDTLWMVLMLFIVLLAICFGRQFYLDLALLIALTGFVSTLALAKFLQRGEIIE